MNLSQIAKNSSEMPNKKWVEISVLVSKNKKKRRGKNKELFGERKREKEIKKKKPAGVNKKFNLSTSVAWNRQK